MAPKAAKKENKAAAKKTAAPAPVVPLPPAGLSWDNLEGVMTDFDLTEQEAVAALEAVLGPRPSHPKDWLPHALLGLPGLGFRV